MSTEQGGPPIGSDSPSELRTPTPTLLERVTDVLKDGKGLDITGSVSHTQSLQIEGRQRNINLTTILAGFRNPMYGTMGTVAPILARHYHRAGVRPMPIDIYQERESTLDNKLFFAAQEGEDITIIGIRIYDHVSMSLGLDKNIRIQLKTEGGYDFGLSQRTINFMAADVAIHHDIITSPTPPPRWTTQRRRLLVRIEILRNEGGIEPEIISILGISDRKLQNGIRRLLQLGRTERRHRTPEEIDEADRAIASEYESGKTYEDIGIEHHLHPDNVDRSIRRGRNKGLVVSRRKPDPEMFTPWKELILQWKKEGITDREIARRLAVETHQEVTVAQVKTQVRNLITDGKLFSNEAEVHDLAKIDNKIFTYRRANPNKTNDEAAAELGMTPSVYKGGVKRLRAGKILKSKYPKRDEKET